MITRNGRLSALAILVVMFFMLGCSKTKVGDIVSFARYEWRVLAIQEDRMLLITQDVIDLGLFHNTRDDITWETSNVRSRLSIIYGMAGMREREQIIEFANVNDGNPQYGTPGGNTIMDRVFLLSIAEIYQYFTDEEDRVAYYNGEPVSWWLRTPGMVNGYTSFVLENGSIDMRGSVNHQTVLGVRPAMWVKLDI